ncbi:MAG: PEP-CTERM sorting domain-containing protein, partial [Lentisphaerae bacterium]|nr:PEP-CTERM sorting domain-containing protein [Lentisphaerota bacterium]
SGVTPFTATGSVDVSLGNLAIDMGAFAGSGDIPLINSAVAFTGPFANAAEGDPYGTYTLTYLGGDDGFDVVLEAPPVPEPAGLGLIGLALLAVRRRRS